MEDYRKLAAKLRICHNPDVDCDGCEDEQVEGCIHKNIGLAADAIENLLTENAALRQQEHFRDLTKMVEPLTLDELRRMDGEPVWCEIYIKGQPSFYGIVHGETVTGFISGDDKPANLAITNVGAYGLAWLAYRQKPEEDGNA